ncbi:hypothetical protein U1Q18_015093 [Sarracenia purpurea var. burkii]
MKAQAYDVYSSVVIFSRFVWSALVPRAHGTQPNSCSAVYGLTLVCRSHATQRPCELFDIAMTWHAKLA